MRLFRHSWWQHLDYRVKVATTQENKPPTQGTRQWTFTTPRWRCGSILLPSLNAGVSEPTGGVRHGVAVAAYFQLASRSQVKISQQRIFSTSSVISAQPHLRHPKDFRPASSLDSRQAVS